MKKIAYCLSLLFLIALNARAQKLDIESIFNGSLTPKGMQYLQPMPKSEAYTVLELDKKSQHVQLNQYDFLTLKKVKTLCSSDDFKELETLSEYSFSKDEQKILLATQAQSIYRHSFEAIYFVYDTETKKLLPVANQPIQQPSFNNKGTKVAYVQQNNIFVFDLQTKKTEQITFDGKKNHIINGSSDWVYEEEFAIVKMYQWNADDSKLAYIKFDESKVPDFSMDVYEKSLYPRQDVFKYPKAGEPNAKVSLHIYDFNAQKDIKINLDESQDFYLPRLKWTNDATVLSFQKLNRHQNHWQLFSVNTQNYQPKIIIEEKNKTYVEVSDHLFFLKDNSFIASSEKDGFMHLYHYHKSGKLLKQVTKGPWEVTQFYGVDEKNKTIYYQSTELGSIERGLYAISLTGKNKKLLSEKSGTSNATFSPNFKVFINEFSSKKSAPKYTLNSNSGKFIKTIVENSELEHKINALNLTPKEFIVIKNAKNQDLNAWIMKPKNFDASKKYPLFMFQYSGPGSQQVSNSWWNSNDYWHAMLTDLGYIVLCVDPTGTGFKGSDFKKATQFNLGKYEVEDQVYVAQKMAKESYIDSSRIGIWGWSFGGFMSSNCLLQAPDVFKTAIAVAPVTSWRFYDTVYTERFLSTPQENASGYDQNSPLTYASNLKGRYLLIHGTADDNVHVQNSMRLISELIHLNKDFQWLIYPDKNHGIYGGKTRIQLYTQMTNFLIKNL